MPAPERVKMGNATPTITEKTCPDLKGNVYIVTGSNSGIGALLAQILYDRHATVYIAARSALKAKAAIHDMKAKSPNSKGALAFLKLDLNDLSTIRSSAEEFLSKETRLDVLWNNAGVLTPPVGSESAQGYELQLGVNCVGPFLFTKLLTPIMITTTKTAEKGSARVVWLASQAAKLYAPENGVDMSNLDNHLPRNENALYGASKAGNIFYGSEYARRFGKFGVISVSADPGNLKTDLYKHFPAWKRFVVNMILKEPIYGAYTELYAALSPDISLANNGAFIEPFGKIGEPRADVGKSLKLEAEGGSGIAARFWDWTEKEVASYV
ncbi:NAD(P)-binding protein [Cadophora sp. DSE1049]|nr:NAD(P)-binding protein [Cadophora sp. DSE1049]